MAKLEKHFQAKLIKELKELYPDDIIINNDGSYIQGFPDITIFHEDTWASLECKRDASAKKQPNQDYYVDKMDDMSFSRFIYPENKDEVLDELQRLFNSKR